MPGFTTQGGEVLPVTEGGAIDPDGSPVAGLFTQEGGGGEGVTGGGGGGVPGDSGVTGGGDTGVTGVNATGGDVGTGGASEPVVRVPVVLEPVVVVLVQVVVLEPVVPVPASAPRSQVATNSSYLICATPRTGSYLLCDLLEATGVAGRPTEYLLAGYRKYWTEQWGTSTYSEYHARILSACTTPNGVFGTKVHGAQLLEFLRLATGKARLPAEDRPDVVAAWFPHPSYIWSRRRDPVAQSVSWAKARQTNLWWDTDSPPAPPLGNPETRRDSVRLRLHRAVDVRARRMGRCMADILRRHRHRAAHGLVRGPAGRSSGHGRPRPRRPGREVTGRLGAPEPGFRRQADETSGSLGVTLQAPRIGKARVDLRGISGSARR